MPRLNDNPLVDGARGNFSKRFVYKKRGKNTHIAKMPTINKKAVPSDKQQKIRDLFSSASLYATGAMSSAVLKKEYQKKARDGKTAFNVAFLDYLKGPVVTSIGTSKYNGTPGSSIVVEAKDNFRVVGIMVSIHSATGTLIEQGEATLNPINRNQWIYAAVQANASPAGSIISATARDLPGNEGKLDVTV
jgi:hypothetical protein